MKQYTVEIHQIGKVKYTIRFYDGKQTHKDGSPFWGIACFKSKKKMVEYEKGLIAKGYLTTGNVWRV
jgi:hypothetical protein